jgi:hypothetical protein
VDANSGRAYRQEIPSSIAKVWRSAIQLSRKISNPIEKRIENIGNDVAEGASIIDRRLSALRAIFPAQLRAAVFTMRELPRKPSGLSIFAANEETLRCRLFDRRNRGVAQDELGWFVGHGANL